MELGYEIDEHDLLAGAVLFLKSRLDFKRALLKARLYICALLMFCVLASSLRYGFSYRSIVAGFALVLFGWVWIAPYSLVGLFKQNFSERMRGRGILDGRIGKFSLNLKDQTIAMASPVGGVVEKHLSEVESILVSKKLVVICFNNDFQIVVPRGKVSSGSLPQFLDELTSRSVRIS